MRIRTDGDNAHRMDTIEAAAERLDCNKTRAVLVSCDVVAGVLDGVEEALQHPELSSRLRAELAETISTRRLDVEVSEPEAGVSLNE